MMRFRLEENFRDNGPNYWEERRNRDFGNPVLSPVDYLAEGWRTTQSLAQSEGIKRQQKFVLPTELLVRHKSNGNVPAVLRF